MSRVWRRRLWRCASIFIAVVSVVEIAEGRQRATSDELDLMWNRLSVDATPVLEQDYVDQPSALGWLLLRLSRRDARKVGDP